MTPNLKRTHADISALGLHRIPSYLIEARLSELQINLTPDKRLNLAVMELREDPPKCIKLVEDLRGNLDTTSYEPLIDLLESPTFQRLVEHNKFRSLCVSVAGELRRRLIFTKPDAPKGPELGPAQPKLSADHRAVKTNKQDIVAATLAHPFVQRMIDRHVFNWVKQRTELSPAVREILTDIARQVAARIVDSPPPRPDFCVNWGSKFNDAALEALPYSKFKEEIVPKVAARVSSILGQINEDALNRSLYGSTLLRITEAAAVVAGMIYHGLNPRLLEASEEQIQLTNSRFARLIAEGQPNKVIVAPADVPPTDLIIQIMERCHKDRTLEESDIQQLIKIFDQSKLTFDASSPSIQTIQINENLRATIKCSVQSGELLVNLRVYRRGQTEEPSAEAICDLSALEFRLVQGDVTFHGIYDDEDGSVTFQVRQGSSYHLEASPRT
jgi:hypothetical protein